jgi:hypothetical protein
MSKLYRLLALGMIVAPLAGPPVFAQAPAGQAAACPPGTQLVPPSRDGAGNPVAAYCASAPTGAGTYDPYTGRNAQDPQATTSSGGPGQFIPPSR